MLEVLAQSVSPTRAGSRVNASKVGFGAFSASCLIIEPTDGEFFAASFESSDNSVENFAPFSSAAA